MNSCTLIGRLVREPELKFIPSSGMAVTKFTLAVDKEMARDKKQEAQAQGKQTADFINVTVFGKQAENYANFLTKGSQCAVHGRIQTGSYTDQNGNKRYTFDVIADRVEFLNTKKEQTEGQQTNNFMPGDDEDIFQPMEDDEDIPFK